MTNALQSAEMAEKPISVRLDADAQRALAQLTARGVSQSQAIRAAVIGAADAAWREEARADARRLATDEQNLRSIAEVQAELEELRAPW